MTIQINRCLTKWMAPTQPSFQIGHMGLEASHFIGKISTGIQRVNWKGTWTCYMFSVRKLDRKSQSNVDVRPLQGVSLFAQKVAKTRVAPSFLAPQWTIDQVDRTLRVVQQGHGFKVQGANTSHKDLGLAENCQESGGNGAGPCGA